jgi:hypothetical protein
MDDQGAIEPFFGGYRIAAGKDGIKVMDMKHTTPIKVADGYKLEDFASWLFLKDKWQMPGDFSIKADKQKYGRHAKLSQQANKELKPVEGIVRAKDKKMQQKFKELKGAVLHNEDGAVEKIREFKNTLLR